MARIPLGPVHVDILDAPALREAVQGLIGRNSPSHIVTLNSLMFRSALKDPGLAAVISGARLITPDSAGIVWAVRFLRGVAAERATGIDLIHFFCGLSRERGYRIFLLGARPGVADKAAQILKEKYPGIVLAGSRHGYFSPGEEDAVIESVRGARPDILLVAFSMARQEKWIAAHLERLNVPVVMGVGGSFDVLSGNLKRAPRWMQRLGCEWLFRLLQEPSRIFRMKDLPIFVWNMVQLKAQSGWKR